MTRVQQLPRERTAIDLFGGAGGWEVLAGKLGMRILGVEWDDAACATRSEAGLLTLQADVSGLDPAIFAPTWGLIGSPPCPTFSNAGDGAGMRLLAVLVVAIRDAAAGIDSRTRARQEAYEILEPLHWLDVLPEARDPERARRARLHGARASRVARRERLRERRRRDAAMSLLMVEPMRYAVAIEPEWIALEQVPPVLPLWRLYAELLTERGYSVWSGILEAERYGVPQTRERAILMASRTRVVAPPRATHQRYVKGEPQRYDLTLEGEILPWVSMAAALGLVEGPKPGPAPTISSGGTASGGGVEVFAGSDARARVAGAVVRTDNVTADGTEKFERPADEPAPTLTSRADLWTVERPAPTLTTTRRSKDGLLVGRQLPDGEGEEVGGWRFRQGNQARATERAIDEPAPTVLFGHRANEVSWVPSGYDRRQGHTGADGSRTMVDVVPIDEPAPTISATSGSRDQWVAERPATTIAGADARVFKPGGHHRPGEQSKDAIRVSVAQAAILQGFPADYPWQGSRTKQFEQIGNAVPPGLAYAILAELVEPAVLEEAAA